MDQAPSYRQLGETQLKEALALLSEAMKDMAGPGARTQLGLAHAFLAVYYELRHQSAPGAPNAVALDKVARRLEDQFGATAGLIRELAQLRKSLDALTRRG